MRALPTGETRRSKRLHKLLHCIPLACIFVSLYITRGQIQESISTHNNLNVIQIASCYEAIEKGTFTKIGEVSKYDDIDETNVESQVTTEGIETLGDYTQQKTESPRKPQDIERAIVAISMGGSAAKTKIVERFVWSARNTGKYSGWIVLLTDAPAERYSYISNWTDHFIAMRTPTEHFTKVHDHIEMSRKRFKTYVVEYMNLDRRLDDVKLIYYLDVDIVFASPISLLFAGLEEKYEIGYNTVNSTNPARMWMFEGNKGWSIQGGQMILDRATSQPCLEEWRWYMDRNLSVKKDQVFLNAMMEEQSLGKMTNCKIVPMQQDSYIDFPGNSDLVATARRVKNSQNRTSGNTYSPLVHIRNTGEVKKTSKWNYHLYIEDVLGVDKNTWKDELGISKKIVFS